MTWCYGDCYGTTPDIHVWRSECECEKAEEKRMKMDAKAPGIMPGEPNYDVVGPIDFTPAEPTGYVPTWPSPVGPADEQEWDGMPPPVAPKGTLYDDPGAVVSGVREFSTGATRDVATDKPDFEGFLSPLVLEAYGAYMHYNRLTAAGVRDSDNWQKGIPLTAYMKSGWRHLFAWWKEHRGWPTHEGLVWALLGVMFNAMGYLHEKLKADPMLLERAVKAANVRRGSGQKVGFIQ